MKWWNWLKSDQKNIEVARMPSWNLHLLKLLNLPLRSTPAGLRSRSAVCCFPPTPAFSEHLQIDSLVPTTLACLGCHMISCVHVKVHGPEIASFTLSWMVSGSSSWQLGSAEVSDCWRDGGGLERLRSLWGLNHSRKDTKVKKWRECRSATWEVS